MLCCVTANGRPCEVGNRDADRARTVGARSFLRDEMAEEGSRDAVCACGAWAVLVDGIKVFCMFLQF